MNLDLVFLERCHTIDEAWHTFRWHLEYLQRFLTCVSVGKQLVWNGRDEKGACTYCKTVLPVFFEEARDLARSERST